MGENLLRGRLTARAVCFSSRVESGAADLSASQFLADHTPGSRPSLTWSLHAQTRDGELVRLAGSRGDVDVLETVKGFGAGERHRALVLVLVDADWTRWTTRDGDLVAENPGDVYYQVVGSLERRPPLSTLRPVPTPSEENVHCVGDVPPGRRCKSRHATLRQALESDEVEAGDTILVFPGRYDGFHKIEKPVRIHGVRPAVRSSTRRATCSASTRRT